MEELKKDQQQKPETELTEKLDTEFPLSGGETDQDLANALRKKEDDEEDEENQYP